MSSTSGPKSKRQKEKKDQEEQKKQSKNKTVIYIGAAVAVIAVVAVAAWFLMQPAAVSLDSMEKSLKDGHFEDVKRVDLSPGLIAAGAVGGIQFNVDGSGHAEDDLIFIYQFNSNDSAKAYAVGKNAIVDGVFLMVDGHDHVLSNNLKNTFSNLTSGKSVHYWGAHSH